jgi:hypothetical protein
MFSKAVNDALAITARMDRKDSAVLFANSTIRDLQVSGYWYKDRKEVKVPITAHNPFIWDLPRDLRVVESVRYNNGIYPRFIKPGSLQGDSSGDYYYFGPTYGAFFNSDFASEMDISYFSYAPRLKYYEDEMPKPARYNEDTNAWEYYNAETREYFPHITKVMPDTGLIYIDIEAEEQARAKVSNWLLEDWYDAVVAGIVRQIFNIVDVQDQSKKWYAIYQEYRRNLDLGSRNESLRQ